MSFVNINKDIDIAAQNVGNFFPHTNIVYRTNPNFADFLPIYVDSRHIVL